MFGKHISAIALICILIFALLVTSCGRQAESESLSEPTSSESSAIEPKPTEEPEPAESSSESSRADSSSSSEPQGSSEAEEPEPSYPIVSWDEFIRDSFDEMELDFADDDPSEDMSYEEYFSTERYLESLELTDTAIGDMSDKPGYIYVKGDTSTPPGWDTFSAEDNLYLYREETGERVLLAEVQGLKSIRIFMDRLYLITDTQIWRCGRLGENLTLVYEHPESIYIETYWSNDRNVLYFLSLGEEQSYWRLYLPGGQADKVCDTSELPNNPDGGSVIPVSNMALKTSGYWGDSEESLLYIYSMRTCKLTPMEYDGPVMYSDEDSWARRYYPLNQY